MKEKTKQKILITGADGFIGRSLCAQLSLDKEKYEVIAVTKNPRSVVAEVVSQHYVVGNIDESTDWQAVLEGVDTIVHLAARVHQPQSFKKGAFNPYWQTNILGTENLAKQAILAGVKRFVFMSSIKVHGECTIDLPFSASHKPNPQGDYAYSKFLAEKSLQKLSQQSKLKLVIIRPPLVYGEGVKGNIARLEKFIRYQIPLPFKSIQNARSLIHVDKLCQFIGHCIQASNVSGKTYLVADEQDFSTPALFQYLAKKHNLRLRLFPCPKRLLWLVFTLLGKKAEYQRLTESLQIAGSRNHLGMRSDPSI